MPTHSTTPPTHPPIHPTCASLFLCPHRPPAPHPGRCPSWWCGRGRLLGRRRRERLPAGRVSPAPSVTTSSSRGMRCWSCPARWVGGRGVWLGSGRTGGEPGGVGGWANDHNETRQGGWVGGRGVGGEPGRGALNRAVPCPPPPHTPHPGDYLPAAAALLPRGLHQPLAGVAQHMPCLPDGAAPGSPQPQRCPSPRRCQQPQPRWRCSSRSLGRGRRAAAPGERQQQQAAAGGGGEGGCGGGRARGAGCWGAKPAWAAGKHSRHVGELPPRWQRRAPCPCRRCRRAQPQEEQQQERRRGQLQQRGQAAAAAALPAGAVCATGAPRYWREAAAWDTPAPAAAAARGGSRGGRGGGRGGGGGSLLDGHDGGGRPGSAGRLSPVSSLQRRFPVGAAQALTGQASLPSHSLARRGHAPALLRLSAERVGRVGEGVREGAAVGQAATHQALELLAEFRRC